MTEEERKQKHKEAMKRYYEKNKARLKSYSTEYKAAHPESVKKSNARYWASNADAINARRRKPQNGNGENS